MANVFKKAASEPLQALPALPAQPEGLPPPFDSPLQPQKRKRYLYEAFDANLHYPHEEKGYQHYLEFCGGGGLVPAVADPLGGAAVSEEQAEQAPPGPALPLEAVADPAPQGAAPAAFVSLAQGLSPFPSFHAPPPPVLVHHRGKTLHFAPGQTLLELEHLLSETVLEGHEQGFSPSEVIGAGKTFSWLLTRVGSAHPLLPTTVCYPGLALEASLFFNWQHVPTELLSSSPPS